MQLRRWASAARHREKVPGVQAPDAKLPSATMANNTTTADGKSASDESTACGPDEDCDHDLACWPHFQGGGENFGVDQ